MPVAVECISKSGLRIWCIYANGHYYPFGGDKTYVEAVADRNTDESMREWIWSESLIPVDSHLNIWVGINEPE